MGETTQTKIIKARVDHRCYWCGETIERGTRYARWAYFDGGGYRIRRRVNVVKCHGECAASWIEGLNKDHDYYSEMVGYAESNRGCTCEKGVCHCKRIVGIACLDGDELRPDICNPNASDVYFVVYLWGFNVWAVDGDKNVYHVNQNHSDGSMVNGVLNGLKIGDHIDDYVVISKALWLLDKYLETVEV